MRPPVAAPIHAATVVQALTEANITHVVTVPDTHQRSVLEALDHQHEIRLMRAATEDDVLGICAGLWIGGARPVALIQQLGLFAAANALRGITYDLRMPLSILAGMYGREVDLAVEDSPKSSVRLCLPLLSSLGLPALLVERHIEASVLAEWFSAPFTATETRIVLLGAPTS